APRFCDTQIAARIRRHYVGSYLLGPPPRIAECEPVERTHDVVDASHGVIVGSRVGTDTAKDSSRGACGVRIGRIRIKIKQPLERRSRSARLRLDLRRGDWPRRVAV